MSKRIGAAFICMAVILALGAASADSWNGTVTALETAYVTAPAEGFADGLKLETGAFVTEGETAGSIRAEKVFAPFDGTVTVVTAAEGDRVSGEVLEISPVSLYTVTCTVSDIAETPENALIHIGETLYIRCTADGSHRAEAVVTAVSGAEFTAETVAGELYVGETVYLYRDTAYAADSRVGKGTVTAHDPLTVSAEGVIRRLRVQSGDRVERGQWLFSVASSDESDIRIPASGIVTEVKASAGEKVKEEQGLAEIAVSCAIRAEVSADDAGLFEKGQTWAYIRGDDPHEEMHSCTVSRILADTGDASATVEFVPEDETLMPIGMGVTIVDAEQ